MYNHVRNIYIEKVVYVESSRHRKDQEKRERRTSKVVVNVEQDDEADVNNGADFY